MRDASQRKQFLNTWETFLSRFGHSTIRSMEPESWPELLRIWRPQIRSRGWRVYNRLPVQNCIPHKTLIATVEIPVEWIEVESHNVSMAYGHVEDCGKPDEPFLTPCLANDNERRTIAIAPLENDAAAVGRPVKASGAVRHPEPSARDFVKRKILTKDPGANRVAICEGMVRAIERNAHVRAGRSSLGILGRGCGGGASSLGAPRHTT